VKRKIGGDAYYFSRDPLNLVNQHSRSHAGFVNGKAVGVQPGPNNEGVSMMTKKAKKNPNRPASSMNTITWGKGASNRKSDIQQYAEAM
jgi:large subunit ribosomal protein L28e